MEILGICPMKKYFIGRYGFCQYTPPWKYIWNMTSSSLCHVDSSTKAALSTVVRIQSSRKCNASTVQKIYVLSNSCQKLMILWYWHCYWYGKWLSALIQWMENDICKSRSNTPHKYAKVNDKAKTQIVEHEREHKRWYEREHLREHWFG